MDRFDVHSARFDRDPWSVYAELRVEEPVHWSDSVGAYVLTRHEDVLAGLRNRAFITDFPFRLNHGLFGRCIVDLDGPDHVAARRALAPVFSQTGIREVVDPIIDDGIERLFADRPARPGAAWIEQLATDLPYYLTTRLLGLPFEDRAWLRPRVRTISDVIELPQRADPQAALAAARELGDYLEDRLERSGPLPVEAPLRALLESADPPWKGWSFHGSLVFFLLAGTETSTCVVANVMRALFLHRVDLASLAGDRARIDAIVRETIRWDPPTHTVLRFAGDDVRVRDVTIPRHSRVLLCLASANRDPAAYEAPDAWLPERDAGISLSFGIGAHACVGARAAQREVAALVEALAREVGGELAPVVEVAPSTGNSFRRPAALRHGFAGEPERALR